MAFNSFMTDKTLEALGKTATEKVSAQSSKLKPRKLELACPEGMKKYAELAAEVGLAAPSIQIEKVKQFLNENDIPVYNLKEVIKYMDEKSDKESKDKCGWEWKPLREQDHKRYLRFGTKAERKWVGVSRTAEDGYVNTIPASDFYEGPSAYITYGGGGGAGGSAGGSVSGGAGGNGGNFASNLQVMQQAQMQGFQIMTMGGGGVAYPSEQQTPSPNGVYDYPIPLHALKKVVLLNKAFGDKVSVFVSDYALAPAIQYPDPFLMAVVQNPHVGKGEGRFVIDFWDEPGFGLAQQLA